MNDIFQHDIATPMSLLIEHEENFTRIVRHDRMEDRAYDIVVPADHPVVVSVADGILRVTRVEWVQVS